MASTALVTHVVVSKFAWFSTLYRQVQILAGHGVHLDRSTLAGWVKRGAPPSPGHSANTYSTVVMAGMDGKAN
jgi:transposase